MEALPKLWTEEGDTITYRFKDGSELVVQSNTPVRSTLARPVFTKAAHGLPDAMDPAYDDEC